VYIAQLEVQDNDGTQVNRDTVYAFQPQSLSQTFFSVNASTGIVTTSGRAFNFESVTSYTLTFTATNVASPPLTTPAVIIVTVTITDVNDNAPVFTRSVYSVNVPAENPTPYSVYRLNATDRDQPGTINSAFTYSLGNASDLFEVDTNTGLLSLLVSTNVSDGPMWIQVIVTDQGSPALSSMAMVIATPVLVTAKAPIITVKPYGATIAENMPSGTYIDTVSAINLNTAGTMQFVIETGNDFGRFAIGSSTGVIVTNGLFDYEMPSDRSFVLTVKALDNGFDFNGSPLVQSSASVTVVINVTDLNDNAPVFSPTSYSGTILEEQVAPVDILTVSATDADSGLNGLISYSILPGTGTSNFNVTETGIVRAIRTIDYDAGVHSYSFTVVATDNGPLPLTKTTIVTVNVLDINDNTPVFSRSSVSVSISENILGAVLTLNATDNDSGANAQITYALVAGNADGQFTVDPNS
jgi:hypothetical protein